MPSGSVSPLMSEAFTVAPEVAYSPTVPMLVLLTTNRSEPDTAMRVGSLSPVMNEAFTVPPEPVYSPTVPASFVT